MIYLKFLFIFKPSQFILIVIYAIRRFYGIQLKEFSIKIFLNLNRKSRNMFGVFFTHVLNIKYLHIIGYSLRMKFLLLLILWVFFYKVQVQIVIYLIDLFYFWNICIMHFFILKGLVHKRCKWEGFNFVIILKIHTR